MPLVRMPNNDVVSFPDDMPPEQIKGLIASKFPKQDAPDTLKDIKDSIVLRGVPEGVTAATIPGLIANSTHLLTDAFRAAGDKAYEENLIPNFMGGDNPNHEKLTHFNENPVPTSSDLLRMGIKALGGKDLYEPRTESGNIANRIAQFTAGGIKAGAPAGQSFASGAVSEVAGQFTKDTPYEGPARLAGAVITPLAYSAGAQALNRSKAVQNTADDIKALSNQAYAQAEQTGGVLTPSFTNKYLDELDNLRPQTSAGKMLSGDSEFSKLVDKMQGLRDRPITLAAAQEIDEYLGDAVDGLTDAGRLTKQAKKILDIQTKFRDMIDNASGADVIGGKSGFDSLKEARQLWSKQARLRDIEKIIARAEMMDNPATGIKSGFRALYNNPSRIRGFSPQERKLIENAAKSGVISDALRTVLGSRLNPIIAFSGGGLGAAAAAQASSMAARGLATKMQLSRAQKVANAIAGTKKSAPAKPQPLRITYQKSLPLPVVLGQAAHSYK